MTVYHPVGTCKMGSPDGEEKGVVLNPRLQVLGVKGLRVADCSICPTLVSGTAQHGTALAQSRPPAGIGLLLRSICPASDLFCSADGRDAQATRTLPRS